MRATDYNEGLWRYCLQLPPQLDGDMRIHGHRSKTVHVSVLGYKHRHRIVIKILRAEAVIFVMDQVEINDFSANASAAERGSQTQESEWRRQLSQLV